MIGIRININNFNPRAPCGARPAAARTPPCASGFQSTRPVRGATFPTEQLKSCVPISIHAPRAGRDAHRTAHRPLRRDFNPRAPCGARLGLGVQLVDDDGHFNPRAPCGARRRPMAATSRTPSFQSTRPVRGATAKESGNSDSNRNFNPRAPCGARRLTRQTSSPQLYFNPRAPCGARQRSERPQGHHNHFNPRAPCGARQPLFHCPFLELAFQSTRPVRGATRSRSGKPLSRPRYFNPRAPCGARRLLTHSFKRGSLFQSTRPVRGATCIFSQEFDNIVISIHAPRAGRDPEAEPHIKSAVHFNPRAPCGARLQLFRSVVDFLLFQSTRPVRGATAERTDGIQRDCISIHAPRAGRDGVTSPDARLQRPISIHAPRAGRDDNVTGIERGLQNFNPRAPCGARLRQFTLVMVVYYFNPRAPCGARQ